MDFEGNGMGEEYGLKHYFNLVIRRRWVIVISICGVLAATVIIHFTAPPVYESVSTFMLETKDIDFSQRGLLLTENRRPVSYYSAILESELFRQRMLDAFPEDMDSTEQISVTLNAWMKLVNDGLILTTPKDFEDLIQLMARGNDARLVFRLARVSADILKSRCREIDREELQNAVDFIEEQKEMAKTSLEDAERSLQEFKEKSAVRVSEENGGLIQELVRKENALTSIQTEKQLSVANIQAYNRRLRQIKDRGGSPSQPLKSDEEVEARQKITQLEDEKNDLIQRYGENHRNVTDLKQRIEAQKRALVNLLIQSSSRGIDLSSGIEFNLWKDIQERKITEELNVFVLDNRERYYRRLIDEFRKTHPDMLAHSMQMMRFTRAKTVSENLYNILLEKGEEAKIKAATGTGGIRIIDNPILPRDPIPRSTAKNLIMGLLLGSGLGFGLALFLDYIDNSIRTEEDIHSLLDLPVMGVIPNLLTQNGVNGRWSPVKKKKKISGSAEKKELEINTFDPVLISHMKAKSPLVESYRSMRSKLKFSSPDRPIRTLAVSSANPSEGKTITTANLGIAFALLGKRVIIVDTDLRKPDQHRVFGIESTPGLTDYLVDEADLEDVIYNSGIENLKLIPSGNLPPNPSEIIESRKMTELMGLLRENSDLVIYDTPPIMAVSDPLLLAANLDGLLLIVKHQKTNRFAAANAANQLREANVKVIGVVMNRTKVSRGYGYYGYYHRTYYYSGDGEGKVNGER